MDARQTASGLGVACALLLGGCNGLGNSDYAIYHCKSDETHLDDDSSPAPLLGFGADAILQWALGTRETHARPITPPAGVSSDLGTSSRAMSFGIARGEGAPVQVAGDPDCDTPDELRIPAQLAIATEDGALHETVPATLTAKSTGYAQLDAALELEQLAGSWNLRVDDRSLRIVQSGVTIRLTPRGHAGQLGMMLEQRSSDAVTLFPGSALLQWPAENPCGPLQISVPLADDDAEWVTPMEDVRQTSWMNTAEPARSASMTIEAAGALCEPGSGERFAPIKVQLQMDGSGDAITLAARLERTDRGLTLELDPSARTSDRPSAFIARFGDFGLDFEGFDTVMLELELTVGVDGASGNFAVVAFEDTCQQVCDARGCSGCGPLAQRRLLELGLTTP